MPEKGATIATRAVRTSASPPRSRSRRVVAAVVAGVVVLGGGVAAAIVLADGSRHSSVTTQTTSGRTTTENAVAGPTLTEITTRERGDELDATLRLAGAPLGRRGLVVRDASIADGRAVLELRQRGLTTRTRGGSYGPVSVRVRRAPGLLRIDVATDAGAFRTIAFRRTNGHSVAVELHRAPPSTGGGTTTQTATVPTTNRTTTTQQPPPTRPPQKPKIESG
jgi:hypothetical protein